MTWMLCYDPVEKAGIKSLKGGLSNLCVVPVARFKDPSMIMHSGILNRHVRVGGDPCFVLSHLSSPFHMIRWRPPLEFGST